MEFRDYFLEQMERHPAMEARDAVKMCYQAAFGAEHLLQDREAAYLYLKEEYDALEADTGLLYEQIHSNMCRVNLAAWKMEQLPLEWLFQMFAETVANTPKQGNLSSGNAWTQWRGWWMNMQSISLWSNGKAFYQDIR